MFTDSNSSPFTFSIINKPDITGYPQYYIVNFFAPADSSVITLNPNLSMIEQNYVQCNNGHSVSFIDYVNNGSAQLVFEFYSPPTANGRIRFFKGQKF